MELQGKIQVTRELNRYFDWGWERAFKFAYDYVLWLLMKHSMKVTNVNWREYVTLERNTRHICFQVEMKGEVIMVRNYIALGYFEMMNEIEESIKLVSFADCEKNRKRLKELFDDFEFVVDNMPMRLFTVFMDWSMFIAILDKCRWIILKMCTFTFDIEKKYIMYVVAWYLRSFQRDTCRKVWDSKTIPEFRMMVFRISDNVFRGAYNSYTFQCELEAYVKRFKPKIRFLHPLTFARRTDFRTPILYYEKVRSLEDIWWGIYQRTMMYDSTREILEPVLGSDITKLIESYLVIICEPSNRKNKRSKNKRRKLLR